VFNLPSQSRSAQPSFLSRKLDLVKNNKKNKEEEEEQEKKKKMMLKHRHGF